MIVAQSEPPRQYPAHVEFPPRVPLKSAFSHVDRLPSNQETIRGVLEIPRIPYPLLVSHTAPV